MRYRSIRQRADDVTFEINLAPMLDVIVNLIPMLLLSVVFVRLVIIETPVPQPIQAAMEQDKKDPKVSIQLHINKSQVEIKLDDKGKKASFSFAKNADSFDLAAIHAKFLEIKKTYPDSFTLEVFPSEDLAYKDIMLIMDEARSIKNGEKELEFFDKVSGKNLPTKLMFPNQSFGNIVEG